VPGPKLKPLAIPAQLISRTFSLFTLPNDSRLWGISDRVLLVEAEGRLQPVATFPQDTSFDSVKGIWQTPEGAIGLAIKPESVSSGADYFLYYSKSAEPCEIPLVIGKPVAIKVPRL
jgi:hypothetical protein